MCQAKRDEKCCKGKRVIDENQYTLCTGAPANLFCKCKELANYFCKCARSEHVQNHGWARGGGTAGLCNYSIV
jgi:hypothetical protein